MPFFACSRTEDVGGRTLIFGGGVTWKRNVIGRRLGSRDVDWWKEAKRLSGSTQIWTVDIDLNQRVCACVPEMKLRSSILTDVSKFLAPAHPPALPFLEDRFNLARK
ncbi:hypothetical protein V6N13_013355 [Hibiscus sabdariffa]